jgi:uncharacterized cupin superfamily protein
MAFRKAPAGSSSTRAIRAGSTTSSERTAASRQAPDTDAHFDELGINLNVLPPGKPMAMYHGEAGEEAFVVLDGECLLIAQGQERTLRKWDFVFCPPWTEHVIVGAGEKPALVLGAGVRKPGIVYPANEAAIRNDAGVEQDTKEPAEAYAKYSRPQPGPAPELP